MKTNQSNSRSEHARNEARDEQGRFESTKDSKMKNDSKTSGKMNHRNQDEKRDSHGKFESSNKNKK